MYKSVFITIIIVLFPMFVVAKKYQELHGQAKPEKKKPEKKVAEKPKVCYSSYWI